LSTVLNTIYSYFDFLTYYVQIIHLVVVFGALISLRLDTEQLSRVYRAWIAILTVMSIYAVYQSAALNLGLPLSDLYFGSAPDRFPAIRYGYSRPTAFFAEPRWFAAFLLSGIAILSGSIGSGVHFISNRRSEYIALGLLTSALVLTGSFAGYISLGVLLVVIIAVPTTRRLGLKISVLLAVFFIIIVPATARLGWSFAEMIVLRTSNNLLELLSYIGSNIPDVGDSGAEPGAAPTEAKTSTNTTDSGQNTPPDSTTTTPQQQKTSGQRSFEEQTSSTKLRFARLIAGLEAWQSNPLLGVGAGQFAGWAAAQDVAGRVPVTTARALDQTNNYWIQILAMSGIMGLSAVATIWGSVIYELSKIRIFANRVEYAVMIAGFLAIAAEFIDSFWGIGITHPYRWVFLALVYSHVRSVVDDEPS
jgi:hypothetical protein